MQFICYTEENKYNSVKSTDLAIYLKFKNVLFRNDGFLNVKWESNQLQGVGEYFHDDF